MRLSSDCPARIPELHRDGNQDQNLVLEKLRRALGQVGHSMSEDCLSVNVWTKGKSAEEKAVLLWIHGGGMICGLGSCGLGKFADKDVKVLL